MFYRLHVSRFFLPVLPEDVTIGTGIKFLKGHSAFQAGRSSAHSAFLIFQKLYAESLKSTHQITESAGASENVAPVPQRARFTRFSRFSMKKGAAYAGTGMR